jgi:dihydrolipoamide dehydrogenase
MKDVDVAIIGAGSAGLNARRSALKHGAESVVMIEDGPYGTTCARVGCMPSKLLIHPAELSHEVDHLERFGLSVEGKRIDGPAVMRRVQSERDRFVGFVEEAIERYPDEQKMRGTARFLDDGLLEVDGEKVRAKSVVIATGSYNWAPPVLEGHEHRVLTNDSIFELEDLPESLVVFGMGVIGLELGQAMSRLGVEVVFFDPAPALGGISDPTVRESIRTTLGEELDMNWGIAADNVTSTDDDITIEWTDLGGHKHSKTFEYLLLATGRRPNVRKLGLENTSAPLDAHGTPVVDHMTMQIGDLPLFMAGDATGERPLLHEAIDEGRIAGQNAATFPMVRAKLRRTPLAITFTDPNIAFVGARFADLAKGTFEVGEVDYTRQGRSRVMGKNKGVVRIYGDRTTGAILGAEMFGPRVEHTAHLLSWAIQMGLTVENALLMPFYHPVVEEGIRTALQDLCKSLKLADLPCSGDELKDGPGV